MICSNAAEGRHEPAIKGIGTIFSHGVFATGVAHSMTQSRISPKPLHGIRQCVSVAGRNEESIMLMLDQFGKAADIRGDYWNPMIHSLDDDEGATSNQTLGTTMKRALR